MIHQVFNHIGECIGQVTDASGDSPMDAAVLMFGEAVSYTKPMPESKPTVRVTGVTEKIRSMTGEFTTKDVHNALGGYNGKNLSAYLGAMTRRGELERVPGSKPVAYRKVSPKTVDLPEPLIVRATNGESQEERAIPQTREN